MQSQKNNSWAWNQQPAVLNIMNQTNTDTEIKEISKNWLIIIKTIITIIIVCGVL